MISWAEARRGVFGAWRLARRDPKGLDYFDTSPRGYWNSFWAAAVVSPAHLGIVLLNGGSSHLSVSVLLIHLISYVIDWVLFPLIMVNVADGLDRRANYPRYIVAYNWSLVVQMAVVLPLTLLAMGFPSHGALVVIQAVSILILIYRAYVAHMALGVGLGASAGIVLLDVLLGALLRSVTMWLIGRALL